MAFDRKIADWAKGVCFGARPDSIEWTRCAGIEFRMRWLEMRWIWILGLAASMAVPSWAVKRLTVAQLEQVLAADSSAHKPDAEIARKISEVGLTERLTERTLTELKEQFPSDSPAVVALQLLADQSAFLDPPAGELPQTPAPDAATQEHMIQAAQKFAAETLPRLPNLLATRTTLSYDDSPQEVTKGGYPDRVGLHLIGTSKAEVSAHSDKVTRVESSTPAPQNGLMTWGEFGSALLIILNDSSEGRTTWSHWEQTSAGLMAVFHYAVDENDSYSACVSRIVVD
jgi:hypothetical protein